MRARLVVIALFALASCKKSPMGRVEQMRDELAGDSPRWNADIPSCGAARATCAKDTAKAIGGTFDDKKPDQISAAAVAFVVAHEHHATDAGSPDVWLAAMRKAAGPGADALRLAVALEMSAVASKHAHAIESDGDARALLADVAHAIPGACKTYDALGDGADPDAMAPQDSPDHSACVQRDLARKEGPGATYGQGLFRGAAGALALWKDALAALREGVAHEDAHTKTVLEKRIASIDESTAKITLKVVAAPTGNTWGQMIEQHNTPLGGDAGARR
jgi:hypothetical protein